MTQYQREKIKLISLISIMLVLYIHSGFHNTSHEIEGMLFNNCLQDFISSKLGRCAVPLFFMISGYLFFINTESGLSTVLFKMKKRVNTLLIPYIIACLFTPAFLIIIESIPGSSNFMNSSGITQNLINTSFVVNIKHLFYKCDNGSPIAFQLWFLRDLIIIVAISPILYYLQRFVNKWLLLFILFCLCYVAIPILPLSGIFFFMSGSILIPYLTEFKNKPLVIGCTMLFLMISAVNLFYDIHILTMMATPIIMLGCFCIWSIYDMIIPKTFMLKDYRLLYVGTGFTFFIYLYHMPIMNIIRKLIVAIIGSDSFGFALSYIMTPILFVIIFIGFGVIFRKFVPKFYGLLVGGR